jgi:hypothetical protein
VSVAITDDEVNVVAGYPVVEHAETETLASLEEPGHPQATVACELE